MATSVVMHRQKNSDCNGDFFVAAALRREIAQQLSCALAAVAELHAVDPYAMNADRRRGEPRMSPGQVEDTLLRPAIHHRRVEKQQVGVTAGAQHAAVADAEHL